MPRFLKILIALIIVLGIYSGVMILLPFLRFSEMKGKIEDAVRNAMSEGDDAIAVKLADAALLDKIPIVDDYFYKIKGDDGEESVLEPETDAQRAEYLAKAKDYFLKHIVRVPNQSITISVEYTQEVYFPFGITYKTDYSHKEFQPLTKF